MSSGCGDVLSLEDLKTAKKHQIFEAEVITGKAGGVAGGADIDHATNPVTLQVQKTLPAVLRDAGFRPAAFTFATGGTLGVNDADMAVLWPGPSGDGQYYVWRGALPKTIPSSSSPATTGGISDTAWVPFGDITLRSELASSAGAGMVGASGGGTVQSGLNDLDARLDTIEAKNTGSVADINAFLTAGGFSKLVQAEAIPHYINGTTIPKNASIPYDHFGLTFKNRRGQVLTMFRRGPTHVNSKGVIMKTVIGADGQWSTPVEVTAMTDATLDARVAAGGMMPNGNIVIAVNYMDPTSSVFDDVKFYKSDDDGDTWTLFQTIDVNQSGGYSYNIPFGQAAIVGAYVVIPRYKRIGNTFYVGYYRSADGGATWTEFDVYSDVTGANDYNESAIVSIGRLAFMVSRIGSGISGKFHLFRSTNGGNTWDDLGDSNFTGGDSAYNVAPSLNILRNESGTPYLVLQYVNRTDQVMYYRTALVSSILSGIYTFSERQRITGGLANSSGYQSGFFEGRRYIGVVYNETSAQASAVGTSVEYSVQNPADYDSGLFAVAALSTYSQSLTGISQKPSKAKLFFSPDATGNNLYEVDALVNSASGTIYGIGALLQFSGGTVVVRTASRVYGSTLFGTGGSEYTSGYYVLRVWL